MNICDKKYEVQWEKGMMDLLETNNSIDKYCETMGYKLAAKIDENMSIVVKKKPWWCPNILYKKIIKDSIEIVFNHP